MYIYNLTVKVDNNIADEWVQWQKEIHIPGVMNTGLFYEYNFFKLLEQDENDGKTFVIQFLTRTLNDYQKYIQLYAQHVSKRIMDKWEDQTIGFQTLLLSVK